MSDQTSGIATTMMRYKTFLFWSPWETVQNPAPLPNRAWEVDLKTQNNTGVTTEQYVYDKTAAATVFGEWLLGLLIVVGIGVWLVRRYR